MTLNGECYIKCVERTNNRLLTSIGLKRYQFVENQRVI